MVVLYKSESEARQVVFLYIYITFILLVVDENLGGGGGRVNDFISFIFIKLIG